MTQPNQSGKGVIKVKLLRAGRVLRSYKVQSDTFTIGTAPGSTIRAAGDPSVKPTHATLYIDEGEITLVPEPDAVVLLNGESVDVAVPSPSDMIKIGKLTLQVELAGSLESVPPIDASAQPPAKPAKTPRRSHPPGRKKQPSASAGTMPGGQQKAPPPKSEALPKASAPVPVPSRPPLESVSKPAASPLSSPSAPPPLKPVSKPAASPLSSPSAPPPLKSVSSPAASPLSGPSVPPPLTNMDKVAVSPFVDPDSGSDLRLFDEDDISANFNFDAKTALFERSSQDTAIARSKGIERDTVPDMSPVPGSAAPQITPDIAPQKEPPPPEAPSPLVLSSAASAPQKEPASPEAPPPSAPSTATSLTSFPDVDAEYYFGEEDEESFVEPFSLADALLSEKKVVKTDGPKEPYSVAHVIRVVNDLVVDAFGVVPDTPYITIDGELKCYVFEDKKAKTSQLILETGPTVSGEIVIRGEKKVLDGSPSFKIELKDGDNALLRGHGGTYKIEVYRPPFASKKGQLFSISYPMMAIVVVLALAFHGAAAYALRYVDLDRVGDISKEEEEVFAEVIMEQPEKPKPKEEQVVQEEVAQDAKAIAERAPKVSQRTIKRRIKQTSQKKQVSSLLSVLSRGSGKAGKSNKLKDLISNIDAVKSKGGGGSGFSIAGAIASLPGKGVNIARSGGGGAISTLSGDQVAGKGSGLASLGTGKRKGKVRGKVTKMSSSAKIGGSLSREDVLRVINSNIHAIQACYERALMGNPSLSGRVAMDWTVASTGRVKSVRVRSSTVGSPKVASCISGVIKRWKFPRPKGGDANITFPFLFRSGS